VLGLGGLLGVVVALMNVSAVSLTAGSVVVACAYLTSLIVRGNTPRTALGTAVRIQVLGFRRYLEDARSHQFSYINAAGTFREYLPWAVVFGLEQRWAEVFAELDVVAEVAELHLAQDLRWFAGIKGPEDALTPTPERPELEGIPRRLAPRVNTGDPDADAETVLVPGGSVVEETIVEVDEAIAPPPVVIDAVPRAGEVVPADEVLVERFAPPPVRRSVMAAVADTGTRVVAAAKLGASDTGRGLVIMSRAVAAGIRGLARPRPRPDAPTPVTPAASPATPVRVTPAVAPAVRQWVPRPSVRPPGVTPRPGPAMPAQEPAGVPTAPVTPRRPPRLDETVAVRQLPPWSDWLDEFDLAMSGDFDADAPDATDGGTVISGPERFDVLLTVPLWPDVPLDTRPDRRAG
jgi:hypothetical protein